ncbi:hypothetical protein [Metabacillus niabensis]|uniref:hypothetical protein n=1 Tax=Metabacillus niabensis TaxID=324854 RepID=UPI0039A0F820
MKKIIASLIAFTMLFAFVTPSMSAFAAEITKPVTQKKVVSTSTTTQGESNVSTGEEVEEAGKLGFLIKLVLEIAEFAFKHGGDIVSSVLKKLDPDTAKYVKNNSDKIAKGLKEAQDKIDEGEEYVHSQLSEILQDAMSLAGVSKTYRVPIADAIATVVLALA